MFGNFFPFTPSGLGITELLFQEILYIFNSDKGFEIGVKLRIASFVLILFLSIMICVMYIFKLFKNEKIKTDYLIVGSGFYGCVIAERILSVLKKK